MGFSRSSGSSGGGGGSGTVTSVTAANGTITVGGTAADPTIAVGAIPESSVTSLVSDLAAKAADSAVVHNTGAESVAGVKTFTSSPIVPTPSSGTQAANKTYVDGVASSGAPDATTSSKGIVQLAGDLAGTAASPTVPGLTGKLAAASNLSDLANAGTARTNLGLGNSATRAVGTTTGTVAAGDDSRITGAAADSAVVHNTGAENVAGVKTFTSAPVVPSGAFPESAVSGLVSDLAAKAPLASPTFTGTVTVPSPSGATDAATKAYVDATAAGLSVKTSVAAAATSNVASLSGTTTVDGVSLSAGNRVLLTAQSTASQNGIWVVASGAWTRPADYTGSVAPGAFVFVEAGTANASSGWVLQGTATVTVDTTNTAWTQFSGAGEITAGTGLSKSGNTLSVSYGTSSGTAAQGNDSRITGALQASSNLSDLGSASTARTNLGLGGAATLSVGTTTGTVAAGDDSRITGAIPLPVPTAVKTGNYTAAAGDMVLVDASGGSFTVTLPTTPADKARILVKMVTVPGTNTVTVACGGSSHFNTTSGATSATLSLLGHAVQLQYQSSTDVWFVVANDLPLKQVNTALTDAATIAIDASLGSRFKVTLGGNRTLGNPTNAYDGQLIVISVSQDGTGGRTVTLGNKYALPTGTSSLAWSTTASLTDEICLRYSSASDKFRVVGFAPGFA